MGGGIHDACSRLERCAGKLAAERIIEMAQVDGSGYNIVDFYQYFIAFAANFSAHARQSVKTRFRPWLSNEKSLERAEAVSSSLGSCKGNLKASTLEDLGVELHGEVMSLVVGLPAEREYGRVRVERHVERVDQLRRPLQNEPAKRFLQDAPN